MSGEAKIEWEVAAQALCDATVKRAPEMVRQASEAFYECFLTDVQDYLRDNTEFNLSSELDMRKREAEAQKARADTAEYSAAYWKGAAERALAKQVEMGREHAEKRDNLVDALSAARDTVLQLYRMRGCEAEGTEEEWVGFIDAALSASSK